mmetsp:Transcript_30681/g.94789  ORF Transcript_30681/g.94789 Transcript_30681/m.94789 type:complete len:273 (-) Transcript_30681:1370-2188(-)
MIGDDVIGKFPPPSVLPPMLTDCRAVCAPAIVARRIEPPCRASVRAASRLSARDDDAAFDWRLAALLTLNGEAVLDASSAAGGSPAFAMWNCTRDRREESGANSAAGFRGLRALEIGGSVTGSGERPLAPPPPASEAFAAATFGDGLRREPAIIGLYPTMRLFERDRRRCGVTDPPGGCSGDRSRRLEAPRPCLGPLPVADSGGNSLAPNGCTGESTGFSGVAPRDVSSGALSGLTPAREAGPSNRSLACGTMGDVGMSSAPCCCCCCSWLW